MRFFRKIINSSNTSLVFLGVFSLSIYLAIFFAREKFNVGTASLPDSFQFSLVMILLFLSLFAYIYGFNFVSSKDKKLILIFFALFVSIAFFIKPLRSTDVYSYISSGRIISEYNQNPYEVVYLNFEKDIFFEKIVSIASTHTSLYGPIFNQFASLYTATAGDSLILSLYLFKFMNMFLFLLGGYLIFKITDRDVKSLYLYLWNPFLIFITIIDVHNEIYWIVAVLVGLLLVKHHQQSLSGFIFLCMSVFVKFFSIILLPYWVYYQTRGLRFSSRIKYIFIYSIVFSLIGILTFSPFWRGLSTFEGLIGLSNINSPLASPAILIIIAFFRLIGKSILTSDARLLSQLLFLTFFIWRLLILRSKINFKILVRELAIIITAFVLTSLSWFMPWYLLGPIVFSIIYLGNGKNYSLNKYVYFLTGYGMLYSLVVI